MSFDKGDTMDLARHLAATCNEAGHLHGVQVAASDMTMETMTGHAFGLSYDGRRYVVLVVPDSASPLMQAEFAEYEQAPPESAPAAPFGSGCWQ